jgi:hypothetical protein
MAQKIIRWGHREMRTINWTYPLTAFLVMILFSQASHAIIITNYTALYEDGSRLTVDLKGYDYGEGSYFVPPTTWSPEPNLPAIEGFEAFLYPSWPFQQASNGDVKPGVIDSFDFSVGLYFKVDKNYGVSMTSFGYVFAEQTSTITSTAIIFPLGIDGCNCDYFTEFSGGFFKTYISPYQVDEPGSLALIIIGITGLAWARQRRKLA